MSDDRRRIARRVGLSLLGVWALISFLLIGSLAIAHWAPLPRPELDNPEVRRALSAYRLPSERGLLALHVLYTACRCSQRIVAHLQERRATLGIDEGVLLVGRERGLRATLERAGFRVSVLRERELSERFHLRTAPLLVVAAPDGELRYLGGYTERKQGLAVLDLQLISAAIQKKPSTALPVFGCAVSRSLQRLLDPFWLKYSRSQGDS